MASLPYLLCHDCIANLEGMARMPYPPTICKDNFELLLIDLSDISDFQSNQHNPYSLFIPLPVPSIP